MKSVANSSSSASLVKSCAGPWPLSEDVFPKTSASSSSDGANFLACIAGQAMAQVWHSNCFAGFFFCIDECFSMLHFFVLIFLFLYISNLSWKRFSSVRVYPDRGPCSLFCGSFCLCRGKGGELLTIWQVFFWEDRFDGAGALFDFCV